MRWKKVDGTAVAEQLIDLVSKRPYSTVQEISQMCELVGIPLTTSEIDDLFDDIDSPFRYLPSRWYIPVAQTEEDAETDDDWAEEADDQLSGLEPSDVDDIDAEESFSVDGESELPSRWIGPALRPWQVEAFNAWVNAGEHGIVEAITGTGKTVVGAYAAARALDAGQKVVVTVPTLDLMDQWVRQLESCINGLEVGRLGDGFHDSLDDVEVLVATIASGSRRYMRAEGFDTLLVADEVHRMGSEIFRRALEDEMVARLGLTATLERTNDTGVEDILLPYFGSVVYTYGYADGLEEEVLAPFRLAFVAANFTDDEAWEYKQLGSEMSGMRHQLQKAGLISGDGLDVFAQIGVLSKQEGLDFRARRWAQKFMTNLSRRRRLQASAQNKLAAIEALSDSIALSQRALVFTETRESADTIAEMLREDSVEAWPFDSSLSRAERAETLEYFRNGDIQVLCAPRVLDEGVDIPDVDVGVIVSASQSRRQMIQRLGRIVRPNTHGDPSTLFLIYLAGTREDPNEGGHEGFLDEVVPHAYDMAHFTADDDPDTIAQWVNDVQES